MFEDLLQSGSPERDLAQLEGAYGAEQARTIWNNRMARLVLPSQGDLRTLQHFSKAIGDERPA